MKRSVVGALAIFALLLPGASPGSAGPAHGYLGAFAQRDAHERDYSVSDLVMHWHSDLSVEGGVVSLRLSDTETLAEARKLGSFSRPFAEPGRPCPNETAGSNQKPKEHYKHCKPAAVSVIVLPNGQILYWDGLHNTERIEYSTAQEIGGRARNDQSRVLVLKGRTWKTPTPGDSGANPDGYDYHYIFPNAPPPLDEVWNDPGQAPGALFCSSQVILKNGKVLVAGGTGYYNEPRVPGTPFGVAELEGLDNTRIFDPATLRWKNVARMHYGRWYPTAVTMGDGNIFVASGVTKLDKPFYPHSPTDSGRNVVQTEIYDLKSGKWTLNPPTANRSLPLYPRLHLLPDGKVYYDGNGQTFNPFGQAYDEATWVQAASYDPETKTWRDLGMPAVPGGFHGSTFSVMLPLRPPYHKVKFVSAGGIIGVTPGTYLATDISQLNTVDTSKEDSFSSELTEPMNFKRWYSTGVMLPTGQVLAFSGADKDEVDFPGTGVPILQAELFNPKTKKWTVMASAHRPRTYHNTAVLLPDGRVLVGGNAPLPTMYGKHQNLPGFSNNFRDPSFEIYSPRYMFRGPRPVIKHVSTRSIRYNRTMTIRTSHTEQIKTVVLVRNPALTHLTDADQRSVVLRVLKKEGDRITVATPPNGNIAPPGPYMLFVNRLAGDPAKHDLIPSVAKQVFVGAPVPSYLKG